MTVESVKMTPQLHTADEAARKLNAEAIKPSWLKAKATAGEIPHVLIAGKIMFSDQHLAEIIAMFERRPTEPKPAAPRRTTSAAPTGTTQLQARKPRRRRVA